MSSTENKVLKELFDDLSNKNDKTPSETDLTNMKKSNVNTKSSCQGAYKYISSKEALNHFKNNEHTLYIVTVNENGKNEFKAFRKCKRNCSDGSGFCTSHKNANKATLKIFETDILPKGIDDPDRCLASIDHEYFLGAKKKIAKAEENKKKDINKYNKNDPIFIILNGKNEKMKIQLTIEATKILNNNDTSKEKLTESKASSKKSSSILDSISEIKSSIETKTNDVDEIDSESDSDDASEKSDSDDEDLEKEDVKINEGEDESDEEISVIEIETKKKRKLYWSEEKNYVMDPQDEETVIGIMVAVENKYSTIIHEGKNYTVVKDRKHSEKGKIFHCVLSNNVFGENSKFIGTYKEKKGEIKYKFI